ncbi:MaoC family dehydratase N-terminal domain-containing protein [Chloroflexota bacterium]
MTTGKTYLTPEVKAMIGVEGERVEITMWGIEKEGLRRFTQGIMDPDPRYWDEDFARTTKFGEIVTPPIYCTYLDRTRPGSEDPITQAFKENSVSDGVGGVQHRLQQGALPPVPTELVRLINAGNEAEVLQYPRLGDRVFSQAKYANIVERTGRDGTPMLFITTEKTFTNQKGEVLCIQRGMSMRR